MRRHSRLTSLLAAALFISVALPSGASAKLVELGAIPDGVLGSCPGDPAVADSCQAVSRTTGYQAKVGPDRTLYQAPANGRIVAWSIALGNPGPKQIEFFSQRLGGHSQATVVVLAPEKKLVRRVVAKAPLRRLTPYFGSVVQFPLERTLRIRKGQYVGLSVPSWAPALQIALGTDTSWRASRPNDACGATSMQSALVGARRAVPFGCLFKTARLTYSATFISDPVAPKRS